MITKPGFGQSVKSVGFGHYVIYRFTYRADQQPIWQQIFLHKKSVFYIIEWPSEKSKTSK